MLPQLKKFQKFVYRNSSNLQCFDISTDFVFICTETEVHQYKRATNTPVVGLLLFTPLFSAFYKNKFFLSSKKNIYYFKYNLFKIKNLGTFTTCFFVNNLLITVDGDSTTINLFKIDTEKEAPITKTNIYNLELLPQDNKDDYSAGDSMINSKNGSTTVASSEYNDKNSLHENNGDRLSNNANKIYVERHEAAFCNDNKARNSNNTNNGITENPLLKSMDIEETLCDDKTTVSCRKDNKQPYAKAENIDYLRDDECEENKSKINDIKLLDTDSKQNNSSELTILNKSDIDNIITQTVNTNYNLSMVTHHLPQVKQLKKLKFVTSTKFGLSSASCTSNDLIILGFENGAIATIPIGHLEPLQNSFKLKAICNLQSPVLSLAVEDSLLFALTLSGVFKIEMTSLNSAPLYTKVQGKQIIVHKNKLFVLQARNVVMLDFNLIVLNSFFSYVDIKEIKIKDQCFYVGFTNGMLCEYDIQCLDINK